MGIVQQISAWFIRPVTILSIDFNKPWWDIFFQQKRLMLLTIIYLLINEPLVTLMPVAFGWALETQSYHNLLLVGIGYLLLEFLALFMYYPTSQKLYNQTHDSFHYNAFRHLLTIDPIFHVQRPSGMILGKIKRTTNAYLELELAIVAELVPFIIQIATVIIASILVSVTFGLIVTVCIAFLSVIYCLTVIRTTAALEVEANRQDDMANQISTESLIQVNFIRASFASNEMRERIFQKHQKLVWLQTLLWMLYNLITSCFALFYYLSCALIAGILIYFIKQGNISPVFAATLMFTYFQGTSDVFSMDKTLKTMIKSYRLIKDFYSFIRVFGEQTYPVFLEDLEKKVTIPLKQTININFEKITFAYPHQPPLFEHVSVKLEMPSEGNNKLFGIIGPSGVGKTTFISILGGQLKPHSGSVTINRINIYSIDDAIRRTLIALQGQMATSFQGTLRYNLLFGLPDSYSPTDESLIQLLNNVGLWKLFLEKEGLKTEIGESGLNLSGGQRQRLNFANLYLRAKYYKPMLILIDEPTSSLDEISERALTIMINELARNSITFVIAHRLKTLQEAHALLDFSLLAPGKQLEFYTADELMKKSDYYQKLVAGKASIEN